MFDPSLPNHSAKQSPCVKLVSGLICVMIVLVCGCSADATRADPGVGTTAGALGTTSALCEHVVSVHHRVRIAPDIVLDVIEKSAPRDFRERPRRALLMLPPTLATNVIYDASPAGAPDFDALDRAACAGFFAFSPSYEGYGDSSQPADGASVTAERLLGDMGSLVEWIRRTHHVRRVDLFGMSIGSSLAIALGGTHSSIDPHHVGRIVLASNVYKSVTPYFQQVFFNPGLKAFLESAPNGYVETTPGAYAPLLGEADPVAVQWVGQNLPGRYATGPTLEGFDLPVFDAHAGRAPALQVWGDADPVTPPEDVATFQSEYGGPVSLHVITGGGHSLLFESGRDELWRATFEFLGKPRSCDGAR